MEYLKDTTAHPSAEDVHLAMKASHPRVSFGTVYRNLNILVDQGIAKRLESSRGRDRFDAGMPFHAHFKCNICGGLYDLPLAPERLARDLFGKTGHEISGHNIEFYGVCSFCNTGS